MGELSAGRLALEGATIAGTRLDEGSDHSPAILSMTIFMNNVPAELFQPHEVSVRTQPQDNL